MQSMSSLARGLIIARFIASSHPRTTHCIRPFSSSPRSTRATTAPLRFHPEANSRKAFLAELRAFTEKSRVPIENLSSALPLSFSGDAQLVLSGSRRVMDRSSEFNFSCTACGSCCKSYPNDVMLDPHDVWLISRAEGIRQKLASSTPPTTDQSIQQRAAAHTLQSSTTTSLYQTFPKAFRHQLGLFESGDYLSDGQAERMDSSHKLAPVLFLRTKRIKQFSRQNPTESIIQERCWFAAPAEKNDVEMIQSQDEYDRGDSSASPRAVRSPRASPVASPKKGLTCLLGPANQPTSCALYPLGELYTEPKRHTAMEKDDTPSHITSRAQYWSLDTTNCEGTRVKPSPSTRTTVAEYANRNGLVQRRMEWEWFESLARKVAATGWLSTDERASPLTMDLREEIRNILSTIWYDFDSVHSVGGRFDDWNSAKDAITRNTEELLSAIQQFVDRPSNVTASRASAQLRSRLQKFGTSPSAGGG